MDWEWKGVVIFTQVRKCAIAIYVENNLQQLKFGK